MNYNEDKRSAKASNTSTVTTEGLLVGRDPLLSKLNRQLQKINEDYSNFVWKSILKEVNTKEEFLKSIEEYELDNVNDIVKQIYLNSDTNINLNDIRRELYKYSSVYILTDVPVDKLIIQYEDLVEKEVGNKPFKSDKPIVITDDYWVIDGRHRAVSAKMLGIKTLRAYVPAGLWWDLGHKILESLNTKNIHENKQKQFDILQKNNPMRDDYHVGIHSINDIKDFKDVIDDEESFVWGDFSREDAINALEKGKITVYSSYPIQQGTFVSTSKNQARDYAGGNKIYSKEVNLNDVAWINGDEGQYASLNEKLEVLDKIEYLYNPTKSELEGLANKAQNEIRGIYMIASDEVYIWNAYEYTHSYISSKLGISGKMIEFRVNDNTIFGNGPDGTLNEWQIDILKNSRLMDLGLQIFNPLNESIYARLNKQLNRFLEEEFIVYHGTNSAFDKFNIDKIGQNTGTGKYFNFTDNIKVAKSYGSVILKCKLNMQDYIEIDCNGRSHIIFNDKEYTPSEFALYISEINDDLENQYEIEEEIKDELEYHGWDRFSDKIDGIILNNVNDTFDMFDNIISTNYIVFDPNQIEILDKKLNIEENLNERLEELTTGVYATNSVYDVINIMKNKPKAYRIVYDPSINYYFFGDAYNYIHQDILEIAYKNAFYPDLYDEGEIRDYMDDKMFNEEILLFSFYPSEDKTLDTEKSSDGYTRKYVYDFGTIYCHEMTPLEKFDIYNTLGKPEKKEFVYESLLEMAPNYNSDFTGLP